MKVCFVGMQSEDREEEREEEREEDREGGREEKEVRGGVWVWLEHDNEDRGVFTRLLE